MISSQRPTLARQAHLREAVLTPAALTALSMGAGVQISLPREHGAVELARAVAEEVGVMVTAALVADEIALTFSPCLSS